MLFRLLRASVRDARCALVALRRDPLFVVVASGSLALALGVVTSVYGVVDAAVHPPTAVYDAARVVYVWNAGQGASPGYSASVFADLVRERQRVFAQTALMEVSPTPYTIDSHAAYGPGLVVSREFFRTTGIVPLIGRSFGPGDYAASSAPVAMIGFRAWRKTLGGQRSAVGSSVDVNGRSYTIIGVMPADASWWLGSDIVLPATSGVRLFAPQVIGRLRSGVTSDAARDQLQREIDPVLTSEYGVGRRPFRTFIRRVAPLPQTMNDLDKMLLAASALIVLIACANLASLMLARGLRRSREYALRFALGARRSSIVRQTLIEALACALLAGALGVLLATWLFQLLSTHLTRDVPQLGVVALSLNWRVFAFAALASVAAALIFGTYPALRASSTKLHDPLKDGAATMTRARTRYSPLVITQVALTLALLMGANLLVQSAGEQRDREIGFEPRGLLSVNTFLPRDQRDAIDIPRVREALMSSIAREPGVQAVATLRRAAPVASNVVVTLASGGSRRSYLPSYDHVSPNYLATLGVRVVDGRDLVPGDEDASVGAAVVSRTAARLLWRGENPMGQMVSLADIGRVGPLVRVVGIADDVAAPIAATPDAEPFPTIYVAARDSVARLETILVRTSASREREMQTRIVHRAHAAVPPRSAVQVTPYLAGLDAEVALRYFIAGVFIAFGMLALGLALFGVYSVRAHDVAHRAREFAVRISLGATGEMIVRSVLRDSVVIVLAGTAIGAFLAMYAGRQLDPWLYGVFYTDVRALIVAEALLIATTIAASLAPALRAARSNPVEILRAT